MGIARTVTIALLVTGVAVTTQAPAGVAASASSASRPARSKFVGAPPRIVASHAATLRRHRDPNAALSLNLGLAVHGSGELDAVIRAASTPGSEAYGRYLDHEQYMARFAPTDAEVAAVGSWVAGKGMRVTGVSADNLIVSVAATTAVAERAFAVTVNEYSDGERTFFANDIAPSVPVDSSVRWVTGLDDYTVARSFVEPSFRSGGYFPSDFQKGYNTGSATSAQSIGFTLWGAPLVQSDLTQFATHTGSPPIVVNGVGASGIDFIPCTNSACTPGGTQSTDKSVWIETALDVEAAHGVAPGSHMKYWLAHTTSTQPDLGALENAVNAAANDSTIRVVSNSWGVSADTYDPNIDASLQHGAAVGKTFFFSSGDTAEISYPATSPYVVSVGGTNLALDGTFAYSGETAWAGSGTGCSAHFARPSWQIGVGAATCSGRAEPDVAADADAATGAYVYYNGGAAQVGGTSLSAPLWAGMTAVWNQANADASRPLVGFAAPLLYEFGNNPSVYNQVFHDVTSGSAGGNPAGPGWDQVTGWGSPNLANLIAQHQGLVETVTTIVASKNPTALGTNVVFTATVSPVPNGGTVTFRQNGKTVSGCSAKALSSGAHATCSIAYTQATTYKVQASYSGNATYAGDASSVLYEKVNPAPTPSSGYWMVNRTGAVFAFGTADWRGNASTQNVSHFEPTPSRNGYWIVNRAGQVFAFGDARVLGGVPALAVGESVSSLSATPTGHGYWLFTSKGRAITYGDAHFYGDMRRVALNGPVIGSVATPSGHGYFMVASDGGIFSFGDAGFFGSTGRLRLNKPVNGLVPTATNGGYWMVASDGGIFAFGDAAFRGSMGGRVLNAPVVGMVRYGNGYLMVASDGGIFNFSNAPFRGSLGDRTLDQPIVSVAS
jgi:kumamolisin